MGKQIDDYLKNRGEQGWIGPGWIPLIYLTEAVLDKLIPGYKFAQVKEKFGTLRVYLDYPEQVDSEDVGLAIRFIGIVEGVSATICEECGQPGARDTTYSWIRTLCEDHALERARIREELHRDD